jgi:hypothetical protein
MENPSPLTSAGEGGSELKSMRQRTNSDASAQRAILSLAVGLHNVATARSAMRRNVGPAIMGIDIRLFR